MTRTRTGRWSAAAVLVAIGAATPAATQPPAPAATVGDPVPRAVRDMYRRGLRYLSTQQTDSGGFGGRYEGPGTTGMAVMAFLASGEDPNYGEYRLQVRRGLRSMVSGQNKSTGYMGNSMYQHGFAMLGLAEAYGAVDDRGLWPTGNQTVGGALELAVGAALAAQKENPYGAWRYSPTSRDADTSVSGAVMVGLLAARNAGIEVPDASIDRAIRYFKSMTGKDGSVGYSGGVTRGFASSLPRSSIASLVYAIARRKDLTEYEVILDSLKSNQQLFTTGPYQAYGNYYQAQALFQGDVGVWQRWNELLVERLKKSQQADGSFSGQFGPQTTTQLSLLALAVNYRFLPIYER